MSKQIKFIQGNEACALGAMYAGLDFYAGYPITPSTQMGEYWAEAAAAGHINVSERPLIFIEATNSSAWINVAQGILLTAGILFLFLFNFRTTLISLAALPVSLIVAVLAMKISGATINTMTLGGMAIAIGAGNIAGVIPFLVSLAMKGPTMARAAELRPTDRQLVVLPLFHANAQYYSFASAIWVGASVALMLSVSAVNPATCLHYGAVPNCCSSKRKSSKRRQLTCFARGFPTRRHGHRS